MNEKTATKSSPRTIKAGRKNMTLSYSNEDGAHWVFEDYASGEFQIHGPFKTKIEADSEMAELRAGGGSMNFSPNLVRSSRDAG